MASFCYGREDIIPDMFRQLIKRLSKKDPQRWRKLGFYFTEHIDCDENRHGPMARTMLERHCSQDIAQSDEAVQTAKNALLQRKQFWDDIHKNYEFQIDLINWPQSQGVFQPLPSLKNLFHNNLHQRLPCSISRYRDQ